MRKQMLVFALLMLIFSPLVLAQVDLNQQPSDADKATFDQILQPVMKIYNFVKYIATAIAGIILLIAGINYMFSGSDPRKRENAKNMAMYVIIGLIIIWGTPFIVNLLIG